MENNERVGFRDTLLSLGQAHPDAEVHLDGTDYNTPIQVDLGIIDLLGDYFDNLEGGKAAQHSCEIEETENGVILRTFHFLTGERIADTTITW